MADELAVRAGATVRYNGFELYQKIREIEGYLIELRYVDRALHYIDERSADLPHRTVLGTAHVTISLGETYPFQRLLQVDAAVKPWDLGLPWQRADDPAGSGGVRHRGEPLGHRQR